MISKEILKQVQDDVLECYSTVSFYLNIVKTNNMWLQWKLMRKNVSTLIAILLCLPILSSPIFAQNEQNTLESCFAYYDYGKVQTHLALEKTSYSPGETAQIRGTVVNNNTFPLTEVVLYAHVKRVNERTFSQNGHFLVNRLILKEDLSFLPSETKWITVDLPILPTYPNGDYQIHYFLLSKGGFHYGGRPFVEEDTAGYSTFKIEGGIDPVVYFDIDSLKVNGKERKIRDPIVTYPYDQINFTVDLINELNSSSSIPALIKWYSFEDTSESLLVASEEKMILPNEKTLFLTFTPPATGAYILLIEIEKPIASTFKFRFATADQTASQLRLNDVGTTDFPAKSSSRAWVCFHSPSNSNTPETEITLSVFDKTGKIVAQRTITESFTPQVKAISVPLSQLTPSNDFRVQAQFRNAHDSQPAKTVEVTYNCSKFKNSVFQLKGNYDQEIGGLSLQGTGPCEEKTDGGYIESVLIADRQGEIKKELYNLNPIPERLDLADLEPGDYQAKIKSGQMTEVVDFTKSKRKGEINLKVLILVFFGIVLLGFIYLKIKWQKKNLSL